jgi:hypothetical protein
MKRRKIRLSKIFTSIPMWALIITHFGNNWGLYTTLTLMPTYFQKILLMDIKHVLNKSSLFLFLNQIQIYHSRMAYFRVFPGYYQL